MYRIQTQSKPFVRIRLRNGYGVFGDLKRISGVFLCSFSFELVAVYARISVLRDTTIDEGRHSTQARFNGAARASRAEWRITGKGSGQYLL